MTHAMLWSGGKDSAMALQRARAGGLEVGCLLNFIDPGTGRVRFHATRAGMIARQADELGLPLRQRAAAWEDFGAAFARELATLRSDGFAGLVLGDIHLADVRAWYEARVIAAGLEHVEPLWGDPPSALLEEYVQGGGRAVVTCCDLARLDESWLGRVIDERFLVDIATVAVDPCGENGEYHSYAFAGPGFAQPVGWLPGATRSEPGFVQLDVIEAD